MQIANSQGFSDNAVAFIKLSLYPFHPSQSAHRKFKVDENIFVVALKE